MLDDLTALLQPTPAALDTGNLSQAKTARRKPFQAQWARLPVSWLIALRRTKSAAAKQLAMEILFAEFRRQHTGGEVVLSATMTGLPHPARARATKKLVELGLIEVEQHGRQAPRVTRVHAGDDGR